MKTEEVPCYVCKSSEHEPYATENGFDLVRCTSCGLLYMPVRPSLSEITAATKTGQHRGENTFDMTGSFKPQRIPRYLRILKDFFPNGFETPQSWMDIGCGHGEFIVALKEYFGDDVNPRGCEPNLGKGECARNRGLDVDFFDLSNHERSYGVLSLLNVFSHLPDPLTTLTEWRRLICPGGLIFLETGHSSHLSPADHHKPYFLPDHLCFANKQIVEELLESIGFKILRTKIYRHTVFPPLRMRSVAKQILKVKPAVKFALGRESSLTAMFPRKPKRDMFILAQLDA